MSNLKFTNQAHWEALESHLSGERAERFAFVHCQLLATDHDGPVLEVAHVELVDASEVETDGSGWYLTDAALDRVHNAAIAGRHVPVEFHNHRNGPPGFSTTDEAGLTPMADYVTGLLPHHTYGAGVYAAGRVHVEHWTRTSNGVTRRPFRSVTVFGDHLRLVNALASPEPERLARQHDVLGASGAATLGQLRIAVVGSGGTGSHAGLALAYLGASEVLVLDDDHVEITNLNRLVTAGQADLGAPKNLVARRRMREVDHRIDVTGLPAITPTGPHPELDDVDVIIGCVDHDGPRDRLNQIAIDTRTPYIDIATGIDLAGNPPEIGGRVVTVAPGEACLHCLGELDAGEISRWAKDAQQQALDRAHGYGTATPNPAVVHLNGIAVHAAIGELVAWISGNRPAAQYLDIDLSGFLARSGSPPGCRVAPRLPVRPVQDCIACGAPDVSGPPPNRGPAISSDSTSELPSDSVAQVLPGGNGTDEGNRHAHPTDSHRLGPEALRDRGRSQDPRGTCQR